MSNFPSTAEGPTAASGSVYAIHLSKNLSPDMVRMVEDLVRMFVIQVTIQFLLYLTDSCQYKFFTPEFIVLLIYILIAVMLYWLIFKKVVTFL